MFSCEQQLSIDRAKTSPYPRNEPKSRAFSRSVFQRQYARGGPMKRIVVAAIACGMLAFAGQVWAQEKLIVWWVKGFYKSEDDALFEAIKKFEQKTGVHIELSQYAVQDMIPKTVSALDSGTPPDVAYADVYDFQVTGKWAYEGKLEDISDVLTPLKAKYLPNTLETTYL